MNVKKVLLLIFCGFIGNLSASEEFHLPVIFAVSGTELTDDEVAFFEEFHPIGTILSIWNLEFDEQRNVNKEKLKELCSHIHVYCPHILMDQEGGRVQRLKGSNCYDAPAPGSFSEGIMEENFEEKREALRQNVRRIDEDLLEVGIDVNCAPVCDLLHKDIFSFIGNRSFGTNPKVVHSFAVTWVEQANEDGITSVLKHGPGHGSTVVDSHLGLPVVDKSLPELMQCDFLVFKNIIGRLLQEDGVGEDSFWLMTAHIIYRALDPNHCATQSSIIISFIREQFDFRGKIVSDCICMKALEGELWERAIASLKAGCDYVICVSYNLNQKRTIAEKVRAYLTSQQ